MNLLQIMQKLQAKCKGKKKAQLICISKFCKASPIVCKSQDCLCNKQHPNCLATIRWKIIRNKIKHKMNQQSVQTQQFIKTLEQTYQELLFEINKSYEQFKQQCKLIQLSEKERELVKSIEQNKECELTINFFVELQKEVDRNVIFRFESLNNSIQQIMKAKQDIINRLAQIIFDKKTANSLFLSETNIVNGKNVVRKYDQFINESEVDNDQTIISKLPITQSVKWSVQFKQLEIRNTGPWWGYTGITYNAKMDLDQNNKEQCVGISTTGSLLGAIKSLEYHKQYTNQSSEMTIDLQYNKQYHYLKIMNGPNVYMGMLNTQDIYLIIGIYTKQSQVSVYFQ